MAAATVSVAMQTVHEDNHTILDFNVEFDLPKKVVWGYISEHGQVDKCVLQDI